VDAGTVVLEPTAGPDTLTSERWTWEIEHARSLGAKPEQFLAALQAATNAAPSSRRIPAAPESDGERDLVDELTALLVGTPDDRFGPPMGPEDRALVRNNVSYWMAAGQPVHLLVMWGGLKHYVTDEDQGIDLAEFFAVQQFRQLVSRAEEIYPPGVVILFFLEDFGVWYEDAAAFKEAERQSVENGIEKYLGEFETLLRIAGPTWARPLRFQDVVDGPFDRSVYVRLADRNLDLVRAYWTESGACRAEDLAALESHRALAAAGWSGHILPEMRAHYLTRLTRLYPEASTQERTDRLLRYFTMVLLYQQLRIFSRTRGPLLKVSMYKPAPGIPEGRTTGRIHMRCLPRQLTSTVMPPWTCKGCFRIRRDGTVSVAMQSYPLAWQERLRFVRGWLRDRHRHDGLQIRADALLPDTIEGGFPVSLKRYRDA
jgi:hypothetical protein